MHMLLSAVPLACNFSMSLLFVGVLDKGGLMIPITLGVRLWQVSPEKLQRLAKITAYLT